MTTKALVKLGFDRFVITALSFTTTSSHIRGRHRKVKKANKLKPVYVTLIRTNIEMPTKKICILGLVLKVTDFGDFVLKTIFVLMMILHKDKDDYQARSPLRRQVHDWTRQSGPPSPPNPHPAQSLFLFAVHPISWAFCSTIFLLLQKLLLENGIGHRCW